MLTSGGRVLAAVAITDDLITSALQARNAAQRIKFEGAFHRSDIAKRGCDFLLKQRYVSVISLDFALF